MNSAHGFFSTDISRWGIKRQLPTNYDSINFKSEIGGILPTKLQAVQPSSDEDKDQIPSLLPNIPRTKLLGAQPEDTEPTFDDSLVLLDYYTSDLNLELEQVQFCSAKAMSQKGFGYMWAGARATYGATRGRVCYEVIINGNNDVSHLENEPCPNVLRCGWSVASSSMQLGEEPLSWGYGGTGMKSVNCKFTKYGQKFDVGDVIGCYLDMTCDPHTIGYTVNGFPQGVAFCVTSRELTGQAIFPHILTKNQNFTVNFGQMPAPLRPLMPNFTPIGQLDIADGLIRGHVAPALRQDCEVLLMIGLPGSGKTYWAEKYSKENPAKCYNVLGTNNLIDRMKVMGLPRLRNYHGRWEVLIEKCTDCFSTLLKLASKRKRNYILDQTNVFPTARARKIKDFEDMACKAIVVVPDDEEFQRRCKIRTQEFGKEIPEGAVIEMKANFVLPEFEEVKSKKFCDVFYVELDPHQSHELVKRYNTEATNKGIHMTPGVHNFITRNARLRAEANMFEIIGRMLPKLEATHQGPLETTTERRGALESDNIPPGVKAMNAALANGSSSFFATKEKTETMSTCDDRSPAIYRMNSGPDDNQIQQTNSKNADNGQLSDPRNSSVEGSSSQQMTVQDEFGRDRPLARGNSAEKVSQISEDRCNDRERGSRDRDRDGRRNRQWDKPRSRSRSRGRKRSRSRSKTRSSRDRSRDRGGFNRHRSSKRTRSRSREGERRDHSRRRRSRDRSRSRDYGGFGSDRRFRRSVGWSGMRLLIAN